MSFIGAVGLEAWPVYAIFTSRLDGAPLSLSAEISIATSLAAALGLAPFVFGYSVRYGIRRLGTIEP